MKIIEELEQYQKQVRGRAQLEVFNLVGELLSITLEKYDVEVIIESDQFLMDHDNDSELNGVMKTEIEFEDISEIDNKLEIILSGVIKGQFNYEETFMLFFSLNYDSDVNGPWNPGYRQGNGVNSINLKISRKIEQLSDPVFRIDWVYEDFNGNKLALGNGRGILTFSREKACCAN